MKLSHWIAIIMIAIAMSLPHLADATGHKSLILNETKKVP